MKNIYNKYNVAVKHLENIRYIPLLIMRLILAYGFYSPAIMKYNNFENIVDWFEGMGMPLARLNAYMATGTELLGVVLLVLGLFTRFISIPLIIVLLVAIKTVHFANGFQAGNNGFEIPVYYIIMLFTILVYGPGKLSLDYLLNKYYKRQNSL